LLLFETLNTSFPIDPESDLSVIIVSMDAIDPVVKELVKFPSEYIKFIPGIILPVDIDPVANEPESPICIPILLPKTLMFINKY
jgi:predicted nucleotidyltransferase